MSDAKAATEYEVTTPTDLPRRVGRWRVFAKGCVLALLLGAGWIAGEKTPEIADLAQVSSTAWAEVVAAGTSLKSAALARLASWAAPHERTANSGVESTPATASSEGVLDRFAGKLEQIFAASERAAENCAARPVGWHLQWRAITTSSRPDLRTSLSAWTASNEVDR